MSVRTLYLLTLPRVELLSVLRARAESTHATRVNETNSKNFRDVSFLILRTATV